MAFWHGNLTGLMAYPYRLIHSFNIVVWPEVCECIENVYIFIYNMVLHLKGWKALGNRMKMGGRPIFIYNILHMRAWNLASMNMHYSKAYLVHRIGPSAIFERAVYKWQPPAESPEAALHTVGEICQKVLSLKKRQKFWHHFSKRFAPTWWLRCCWTFKASNEGWVGKATPPKKTLYCSLPWIIVDFKSSNIKIF